MASIAELLTASSVHIDAPGVDVTIGLSSDNQLRAQRPSGSLFTDPRSSSAVYVLTEREGRMVVRGSGSTASVRADCNVLSTSGDLTIGSREPARQTDAPAGLTVDVPPGTWVIIDRAKSYNVACNRDAIVLTDNR